MPMPAPIKFAVGLALVAFPLLEVALLIRASRLIGAGGVALIIIVTGIAGIVVVQQQGLKTFTRTLAALHAGRSGLEPMIDGLLRVTAGVLLILPGLVTDVVGLALLIPAVRQLVARSGLAKLLDGGFGQSEIFERRSETARRGSINNDQHPDAVIIEGEYERVDDPRKSSKPSL
jgi:UPF0716 protein FxsA